MAAENRYMSTEGASLVQLIRDSESKLFDVSTGYVNVTLLAQWKGKDLHRITQTKRIKDRLKELCETTGKTENEIRIIKTSAASRGTWCHPILALEYAAILDNSYLKELEKRLEEGDITMVAQIVQNSDRINNTTSSMIIDTVDNNAPTQAVDKRTQELVQELQREKEKHEKDMKMLALQKDNEKQALQIKLIKEYQQKIDNEKEGRHKAELEAAKKTSFIDADKSDPVRLHLDFKIDAHSTALTNPELATIAKVLPIKITDQILEANIADETKFDRTKAFEIASEIFGVEIKPSNKIFQGKQYRFSHKEHVKGFVRRCMMYTITRCSNVPFIKKKDAFIQAPTWLLKRVSKRFNTYMRRVHDSSKALVDEHDIKKYEKVNDIELEPDSEEEEKAAESATDSDDELVGGHRRSTRNQPSSSSSSSTAVNN